MVSTSANSTCGGCGRKSGWCHRYASVAGVTCMHQPTTVNSRQVSKWLVLVGGQCVAPFHTWIRSWKLSASVPRGRAPDLKQPCAGSWFGDAFYLLGFVLIATVVSYCLGLESCNTKAALSPVVVVAEKVLDLHQPQCLPRTQVP
jgi:hypothetical protein